MKYKVLKKQNSSKTCLVCGVKNDLGLKARFYLPSVYYKFNHIYNYNLK